MFSNVLLPLGILFYHLPRRSLASAPVNLALFLDEECSQASIINPSVNIPVDTCLVTSGALGIAVETLPACTSGEATLIMYQDTSCANPDNSGIQFNNCYFDGPDGVPAVLFACKSAKDGAAATSTSTVSAGSSSIPVAQGTPTPALSGGTSDQNTPSSSGATTTSASPSSPTSPKSSQTSTDSGSASPGSTSSGLSQKAQIALGVGVPVATIVVALLAWWFPCRARRRHGQADQYNLMHHPSQGHAPSTVGISPSNASLGQLSGSTYGNNHGGFGVWEGHGQQGRSW